MNFKKAGTTRDIAGYKCTDYDGGGHVMQGDYTVKECFSKSAPGADEFAAFEKQMTDKLNSASASTADRRGSRWSAARHGRVDETGDWDGGEHPGNEAGAAGKIKETMAKRPPIMTTQVVEKIESKKLADSDFAIPSDYTKKEMPTAPSPGVMRMAPHAAAASPAAH